MAHHYGMLPSQILDQATTFDLQVLDIAQSYRNFMNKKRDGSQEPPKYNPNKLQDLLEQFKQENKDGRSI